MTRQKTCQKTRQITRKSLALAAVALGAAFFSGASAGASTLSMVSVGVFGDTAVRDPATEAPPPPGASLYERLGGRKGIQGWVSEHVDMLLKDARLQMNPALNNAFKKVDRDRMKVSMFEWFCEKTGGPCHYPGRSLHDVHERMELSPTDWKYMLETVHAALEKYNVGPADTKAVIDLMERYKAEVLTRP